MIYLIDIKSSLLFMLNMSNINTGAVMRPLTLNIIIMNTIYIYQSYKKGEKAYERLCTGDRGNFLGLVSRQTKYSYYYINEEGKERSRWRKIIGKK